ncbi:MAG: hypothetical protein IKO62_10950 [Bacteroidales bacterium]|nr:hypothetical protein [Bacteroidales bacterium]
MSNAPLKNLYKFLIYFIFLAGVIAHWLGIGGFPIVLRHSANTVFPAVHTSETVTNPLKDIDVTDAKAFLILSSDDWSERPKGMPARRVLVCTDEEMLRQLKGNFSFEISGGDMATVESELWVYCHDTLVLMTNIDINPNNIGIQNELTGWAEAVNKEALSLLFARFRPYHAPILSLR